MKRVQTDASPRVEPPVDEGEFRRLGVDEHRGECGAEPSGGRGHGTTSRNPPVATARHTKSLLAVGLHRVGYDLDLRQYGDGNWRATFWVTGFAHSILGGSAWEPTAWRAMQRAGWDALEHAERNL